MKSFFAFLKKEGLEAVRSGKLFVLLAVFLLFGIMNPAIAKLIPWMMELMADSLAETGMKVTAVEVTALTSWTQFFKNIPMGLIAFVLIYSNSFTKEYSSNTLVLLLTKGLARYKVLLAKTALMAVLWTVCYWLCFAVTYGYNDYFWDNNIVFHLSFAAFSWWLFGLWTISLIVLFSAVSSSHTGVLLGTAAVVLAAYLLQMLPHIQKYMPTMLLDVSSRLGSGGTLEVYGRPIAVTVVLLVSCIGISIPIMNRKQIG